MIRIKGQSKATKFITSRLAVCNKKKLWKIIYSPSQIKKIATDVDSNKVINLNIVAFSSLNDFPEQVLSVLSFIRYVGKPVSWIIYSDGSHTELETKIFEDTFSFAKIIKHDIEKNYDVSKLKPTLRPFKKELLGFAKSHVMGKKVLFYLNHIIDKPTLFLDSDIIFYKEANILRALLKESVMNWFLPDIIWGNLHSRYKANREPELYQLNSGFILLNKELDNLSEGLNFLKDIEFQYEYFNEQTIWHILSKSNNFMPLDPRKFIVNTSDQFDFFYLYSQKEIAIRHYTGPVRHKMWQRNWKWHLSLS